MVKSILPVLLAVQLAAMDIPSNISVSRAFSGNSGGKGRESICEVHGSIAIHQAVDIR